MECTEQVEASKRENEIDYSKTQPHCEPYSLTLDQEIEELKGDECWLDQLQVIHHMEISLLRNRLDDFRVQCLMAKRGDTNHCKMPNSISIHGYE